VGPAATDRAGTRGGWLGSITGRLTVLYTLSAAGLLLFATGLSYWALTRDIETASEHFLADHVAVLRALLRQDEPEDLAEEVLAARDLYVRVLDASGGALIQTPRMAALLPAELFPAAPRADAAAPNDWSLARVTARRHDYLIATARAALGEPPQAERLLQVALDVTSERGWWRVSAARWRWCWASASRFRPAPAWPWRAAACGRSRRSRARPNGSARRTCTAASIRSAGRASCRRWRPHSTRCWPASRTRSPVCRSFRPIWRTSCADRSIT
jgi:hypothetical protein